MRGLRSGGRRGSRERRGGDPRTVPPHPPRLTEPPPRGEGARAARGRGSGGAPWRLRRRPGPARAEAGRGPRRGRVRPVPEGALFPRAASRAQPALGGHVSPRLARRAVLRRGLLLPRARVRGLTDSRRSTEPCGVRFQWGGGKPSVRTGGAWPAREAPRRARRSGEKRVL